MGTYDSRVDYNCEKLHDGCRLIKRIQLQDYHKHNSWQLKTMRLLKRHYPRHFLDYEPLIICQAFEFHNWHGGWTYSDKSPHTHRTKPHRIKEVSTYQGNIRVWIKLYQEGAKE